MCSHTPTSYGLTSAIPTYGYTADCQAGSCVDSSPAKSFAAIQLGWTQTILPSTFSGYDVELRYYAKCASLPATACSVTFQVTTPCALTKAPVQAYNGSWVQVSLHTHFGGNADEFAPVFRQHHLAPLVMQRRLPSGAVRVWLSHVAATDSPRLCRLVLQRLPLSQRGHCRARPGTNAATQHRRFCVARAFCASRPIEGSGAGGGAVQHDVVRAMIGFALCALLCLALADGQGAFGGNQGGSTFATALTTPGAVTASTVQATSAAPATTAAPTSASAAAEEQPAALFGSASLGPATRDRSCEQANATQQCSRTGVLFSYADLFEGASSGYCCPHRTANAYINGTARSGVWYAGNGGSVGRAPVAQAYAPLAVIGTAVLSDSPFALGLTLTVDSGACAVRSASAAGSRGSIRCRRADARQRGGAVAAGLSIGHVHGRP